MNWIKRTVFATAALVFFAMSASEATAQPTLSGAATGSSITVQWTSVVGATSYNIVVTGAAAIDVPIPSSQTSAGASGVPAGTYNIRVRAMFGATAGPFSNELAIVVGGGGCLPLTPPTIGSSVTGNAVTITWGAVPGAIGFQIQISTTPGGPAAYTSPQFPGNQFSFTSSVPVTGTFYARVLAANACSQVTSSSQLAGDHQFTVGAATPGPPPPGGGSTGPRTPNPPVGQLLPRPTYAAAIVAQMANTFRGEFLNMCRNHTWLYRVLSELRRIDTRWGLNYVRGRAPRVSDDVLAYNPTHLPDEQAQQIYLWDTIFGLDSAGCDTSRQDVWFNDIVGLTWPVVEQRLPNWEGCANYYCAQWTIDAYRAAGFAP